MENMTEKQALKAAAKTHVAFKMLESGMISRMSDEEFDKFLRWLD